MSDEPRNTMRRRFAFEYGAQPLHLIAVIASLLLSGYGLLRIDALDGSVRIFIWIVAGALLHDLVALPLYSLLLRIAKIPVAAAAGSKAAASRALNYVRAPIGFMLLTGLVYFPLIFRMAPEEYMATTGRSVDTYLGRWLLLSGIGFVISGIAYAVSLRREPSRPRLVEPAAAADAAEKEAGLGWRLGAKVTLAGAGAAFLWVAAALVVGLLTTGLRP